MKSRMAMVHKAGTAELVERETPKPGNTEVLIAVKATSVCGGDLHIFKGKHPSAPLPMSLGHELSGEVIEAGKDVTTVRLGDRVTVEPVIVCGECPPCRRRPLRLLRQPELPLSQGSGRHGRLFHCGCALCI